MPRHIKKAILSTGTTPKMGVLGTGTNQKNGRSLEQTQTEKGGLWTGHNSEGGGGHVVLRTGIIVNKEDLSN